MTQLSAMTSARRNASLDYVDTNTPEIVKYIHTDIICIRGCVCQQQIMMGSPELFFQEKNRHGNSSEKINQNRWNLFPLPPHHSPTQANEPGPYNPWMVQLWGGKTNLLMFQIW